MQHFDYVTDAIQYLQRVNSTGDVVCVIRGDGRDGIRLIPCLFRNCSYIGGYRPLRLFAIGVNWLDDYC